MQHQPGEAHREQFLVAVDRLDLVPALGVAQRIAVAQQEQREPLVVAAMLADHLAL